MQICTYSFFTIFILMYEYSYFSIINYARYP